MPENDAHIPGMNAVSFVAYCGELAGLGAVDAMQRAHEVLYYVGLGEARYRNVETYSTGMKQRIKLAQALVHDPDLLFLDEPTNGMDPKGRDEMLELIRDLAHNKGVNLILSSHLLPDVEYTCDRVVVMDKGRIAAQGPIAELKGPSGQRVRAAREDRYRPARAARLRAAGMDCHATDEDVMRVFVPEGLDARVPSSRWPPASGIQLRHLRPSVPDARRRVRARGRRGVAMPIHDQGYRRFGGTRGRARQRVARHRVHRHPDHAPQPQVHGRCCCSPGCRSWCAPSRCTPRPTSRRSRFSRPRPRRSASSSSSRTRSCSSSRSTSAPG